MNTAIEAMQLGARDYLVKPFDQERLLTTLKNTFESQNLKRIVETYHNEIDRHQFCGFIGSSLAMQRVYQIIDSAADSRATIFITGESGTGKEVCAEAIHQHSGRRKAPFIALNCGAIPKDLIESEIFGHVKGAFTGAVGERDGAAKAAQGGTLFLDEICEMDMSLQSKLLRFLQTGTLQKVGSDKTEQVDVRIVCATNKDPLAEVQAGNFRKICFTVYTCCRYTCRRCGNGTTTLSRLPITSSPSTQPRNRKLSPDSNRTANISSATMTGPATSVSYRTLSATSLYCTAVTG